MRLQGVHVDGMGTAVRLVRLTVPGAEQHRAAESGLRRDLSRRLAVAVQLRLVRRRRRNGVMGDNGRQARRFDSGACAGLRLDRRAGRGRNMSPCFAA